MSCNNSHLKSEGAISTFEVIEYVVVGDHLIEKTFLVYFNEDELKVKCTCALFEVRSILCRHSLSVLRTKKVTTLPQRYVMNAFFYGYVHSRTTLKEFVDEYDNVLRRMVESETRADFDSFNRTIPCISALQLEKQFQVVYTNAKFK
jgi:hypothetical protein